MNVTLAQFLQQGLDPTPLGLLLEDTQSGYFCTPVGAHIFAWTGGDGIHFCTVDGFGDTIFVVSPMNLPGDYVHPLASDFTDFLRLLLSCGYTDALEQVCLMDESQFASYLAINPIQEEAQTLLDAIQAAWGLTPMEEPYRYMKTLRDGFDYQSLRFSSAFDFFPPEKTEPPAPQAWEVYFSHQRGGGREKPGVPLSIRKDFIWEGRYWLIPEVYVCGKGLVIDTCTRIPVEEYQAFLQKWNPEQLNDMTPVSFEQELQAQAENPCNLHFNIEATLNGRGLKGSTGSCFYWLHNVDVPQDLAEAAMTHYNLDPNSCWVIWRHSFPWATQRKPQHVSSLVVELEPESVSLPGPRFTVSGPGDQIRFTHPETGVEHVLTVQEYEQQELSVRRGLDPDYEYPTHYTGMCYTLKPDLSTNEFSVQDSEKDDPPRPKEGVQKEGFCGCQTFFLCKIDQDTPIDYGGEGQGRPRGAASSLCFQPKSNLVWSSIFSVIKGRALSIPLL